MTTTTATVLTGCLAPEPATAPTGCLTPIDKGGLETLIESGKANPKVIKTLKCKTVAEGSFRHLNFIRTLPPYIVDEPPALLGDDTAPNPSEASLAALGSCLAVGLHANAVHRGWTVRKLELRARRRPQHHRGLGHRRHQREAGRLHRRARQGRHGMRRRSAGADRRADRACEAMVAGRQHVHAPGQSRGGPVSNERARSHRARPSSTMTQARSRTCRSPSRTVNLQPRRRSPAGARADAKANLPRSSTRSTRATSTPQIAMRASAPRAPMRRTRRPTRTPTCDPTIAAMSEVIGESAARPGS